jgi:hypothetical protein
MDHTSVRKCTCVNKGQDALYGPGKRLFNFATKANTSGSWRCTVCLAIQQPTGDAPTDTSGKQKAKA